MTCKKTIKGANEVTSNFISHLKVRHSEHYRKYVEMKGNNTAESTTSKAAFQKRMIRAIVDCALPVSIVEKQSFKDLFIGTELQPMSRKATMKQLGESYDSMVAAVRNEISSVRYFCTTADIWSGNHRSFLGYTCHWFDQNFERKSAALACKRIFGTHSAGKIAQMIGEVNSSFGLNSSNIVMTITDNGSNFVKAFREYGLSKEREEEDSDDEAPIFDNARYLPQHQRCTSHTLNLLATTDFLRILKDHKAQYIQNERVILYT